jgi:hypothetical protein
MILGLLVLATVAWLGLRWVRSREENPVAAMPDNARAPEDVRIKVEILNATRTKGLARRATFFLRDLGFDVVGTGTSPSQKPSTVVYDRSRHPDWAARVGRAMAAPVVEAPDSSRYLDVTVVLGANWRPPPLPFHP